VATSAAPKEAGVCTGAQGEKGRSAPGELKPGPWGRKGAV